MTVIPMRDGQSACAMAIRSVVDDEVRSAILQRADGACEMCAAAVDVELHHVTYRPAEPIAAMDNLFVLCGPCHASMHGIEN
ncbi:HNH endonuclease [Streptacidiphilus carbonis]|uniref:HNH endonuclease n=1 Tax=Streptacidiphilus carbonis TaxID=105422 RepID=UPI0005A81257|nr:HNH endonuclease [Streptacidiphilus carbonis]